LSVIGQGRRDRKNNWTAEGPLRCSPAERTKDWPELADFSGHRQPAEGIVIGGGKFFFAGKKTPPFWPQAVDLGWIRVLAIFFKKCREPR